MEFCADCLPRFHVEASALALVTLCADCGAKLAQVGRLMCPLPLPQLKEGEKAGRICMGLTEHDGKGNVPELDRDPVGIVVSVEEEPEGSGKKVVAMEIGFSDGGPVEKNTMPPRTARAISRQLAEAAISAEKKLKYRVALKLGPTKRSA